MRQGSATSLGEERPVAAYVILDIDVNDPARYDEYKKMGPPTVSAYGGKYLVRGGKVEVADGEWRPKRLVVLEFPSVAQAKAWLNSPEYAPARKLRKSAARTNLVIVEGAA
jgi:uncharacterized protein (DUF1330 family)